MPPLSRGSTVAREARAKEAEVRTILASTAQEPRTARALWLFAPVSPAPACNSVASATQLDVALRGLEWAIASVLPSELIALIECTIGLDDAPAADLDDVVITLLQFVRQRIRTAQECAVAESTRIGGEILASPEASSRAQRVRQLDQDLRMLEALRAVVEASDGNAQSLRLGQVSTTMALVSRLTSVYNE